MPRTNHTCKQNQNPSRETVPLRLFLDVFDSPLAARIYIPMQKEVKETTENLIMTETDIFRGSVSDDEYFGGT
jgi:hypothetical protein